MVEPTGPLPWKLEYVGYWDHQDQYEIMTDDRSLAVAKLCFVDVDPEIYEDPELEDYEACDAEDFVFGKKTSLNARLMVNAPEMYSMLCELAPRLTFMEKHGMLSDGTSAVLVELKALLDKVDGPGE